jgi:hypothetical protein
LTSFFGAAFSTAGGVETVGMDDGVPAKRDAASTTAAPKPTAVTAICVPLTCRA